MPKRCQTLAERLERSDQWKKRYRSDPQFRLARINARRIAAGKPLATDLPPVGEVLRQIASARPRDEKGRWTS